MLHLIPAPLHRLLYRLADRARRVWWRVRKPRRGGVHVVAFDDSGRVLLVRHSYGPAVWAVPGGGLGRREDPAAAAAREMREELGCALAECTACGQYQAHEWDAGRRQNVFAARLIGEPVADRREVVAVGWFDPGNLPANVSRHAPPIVGLALAAQS